MRRGTVSLAKICAVNDETNVPSWGECKRCDRRDRYPSGPLESIPCIGESGAAIFYDDELMILILNLTNVLYWSLTMVD
jgi:hypothetical protein